MQGSAEVVRPCFTVDVEDFHDGMAELGRPLPGPLGVRLDNLLGILAGLSTEHARLTFFVVGKVAGTLAAPLIELAESGHEIASHGPDHGRLPEGPEELESWLRRGKSMLEDVVQKPVLGFRPPRFDEPGAMTASRFREVIGRAGFTYVSSERSGDDARSPVVDLPVSRAIGLRLGGGSYQRLLPRHVVSSVLRRCPQPAVFYYHSYDFSWGTLPSVWSSRSLLDVRQLLLRRRIPAVFSDLLAEFGSQTCGEVVRALRPVL